MTTDTLTTHGDEGKGAELAAKQALNILRALTLGAAKCTWEDGLSLRIAPDAKAVILCGHVFQGDDLADALGQGLTWMAAEWGIEL